MRYDYTFKITFYKDDPFDENYINLMCQTHPNDRFLIEVQNTKGITSDMIRKLNPNVAIRIAGGYDEDRVNVKGKWKFTNGETGAFYTEAVIYTRNETIKILEEMEKIESGINSNWSDIQKLVYIYDRLKSGIMYDPKFEQKLSSEVRSLRGLITRQTVCAGYAMILKEFMDRWGIECEFVEGYTHNDGKTGAHAWNIITINGKKYPIDLTWDNQKFRTGKSHTFDYLGQSVEAFCKNHFPGKIEKTQDYIHTLSSIDPKYIKQLYELMGASRAQNYNSTTYHGKRKDGSSFVIAQVGSGVINGVTYYRYYYSNVTKGGKKELPLILYSEVNLTLFMDYKKFNKTVPPGFENCVSEILFSQDNIADSLKKGTFYIGSTNKAKPGEKYVPVASWKEIKKPDEKRNLFTMQTKRFKRSDGTIFIAQRRNNKKTNVNNIEVYCFDIFEMVYENGENVLKRNIVYTERDFFKDKRQDMIDKYLSRSRLDRKVKEAGGYIGYYDANGDRTYDPDLVAFFSTGKKVDLEDLENEEMPELNKPTFTLPTFDELSKLAAKYEMFFDSKDPFESDTSKIKIRDIKTKEVVIDKDIIKKAMLANIWLVSAGMKWIPNEIRAGYEYAFNEAAEEFYNEFCKIMQKDCKTKGVIDTSSLLRQADRISKYKYNDMIAINLFRTPFQTEYINKLFLESVGVTKPTKKPDPLYTSSYAYDMAYKTEEQKRRI